MKTTAEWSGTKPETKSFTRRTRGGRAAWACRKVRPDGSIRFLGRDFMAPAEAVIQPEPGEWLLFYDYGPEDKMAHGPFCGEWTAPPDPDGRFRRTSWRLKP